MFNRLIGVSLLMVAGLLVGCSKENEESKPAGEKPTGSVTSLASGDATSASTTSAKLTKVTLALNWVPEPEFGGFYAGRDAGEYKKQNIQIEIKPGGSGAPVAQRVATGDVEFGVVSADEILLLRPKGADLVAVFAVYQTCPQGIMAHASRNLKSIEDVFASGILAVEPGNAYVSYFKKKYDMSKVSIVTYQGGIARFLADKDYAQQCFITAEPISAKQKGVDSTVFLIADTGYNPYTAVVATRGEYLKKNPQIVKAFVAATRAGWQNYLSAPQASNLVMNKLNPEMDVTSMELAATAQKPLIETEETKKNGLGTMTTERWQQLADQLKDLGKIEAAANVAECFVNPQ